MRSFRRNDHLALTQVCRRAVAAGQLAEEQARMFFERNFRLLRITKLGDSAGSASRDWPPSNAGPQESARRCPFGLPGITRPIGFSDKITS